MDQMMKRRKRQSLCFSEQLNFGPELTTMRIGHIRISRTDKSSNNHRLAQLDPKMGNE